MMHKPGLYRTVQVLVVVILLSLIGTLRLWRLPEIPQGLSFDEGAYALDALHVTQGHFAVFFPENQGREGLNMYAIAGAILLLGQGVLAVRVPAALASAGTVLATFWLGQVLFPRRQRYGHDPADQDPAGQWKGLFIGAVAAGLLAVSTTFVIFGRNGLRANFLPFLLALAVGFLWSGMRQRSRWRIVLAGIFAGLVWYTYIPARVTPLLFLLIGLSFVWPQRTSWSKLRSYLPLAILFAAVAFVVAAPILFDFAANPDHFSSRSKALDILQPDVNQGNLIGAFVQNTFAHIASFGYLPDPNATHGPTDQPLLSLGEGLLFWIGLAVAFWRWREPSYRLLWLWLGVLLLPAVLALDAPPNYLRMIGMVSPIYLTAGAGLWWIGRWLQHGYIGATRPHPAGVMGGMVFPASIALTPPRSVVRTTKEQAQGWGLGASAIYGAAMVGLLLVAVQGVRAYRNVYSIWPNDPRMTTELQTDWTPITAEINATPPHAGVSYLIPLGNQYDESWKQYNYEFLYLGQTPSHLIETKTPDTPQRIYDMLQKDAAGNKLKEVRAIDWTNGVHWSGDATGRIPFLLGKYGQPNDTQEYTNYKERSFSRFKMDHPWKLYEVLQPQNVVYDGGITLTGQALGRHGGKQPSGSDPVDVGSKRLVWSVLTWKAQARPAVDYRLSFRLRKADGGDVYQLDDGLYNFDGWPTSRWQPGDASESLTLLQLPDDLPAGTYDLYLIVYDQASLAPAMPAGSDKPEIFLTKVKVS